MSVLGLDVGTSNCKGVVLREDGSILAQEQYSYAGAIRLHGAAAELSPTCFEHSVKHIISALARQTVHDPIRAIALSAHGETLIPIGADGQPRMDAMLSMDRRCQRYSDALAAQLGQQWLYEIIGARMHAQFPVPKVMYLRREHPDIAAQTIHYDTACDYVYRILGCPNVMDYSIAARFGGLDITKRKWSEPIMEAAELSAEIFSEPVCAGTVLGTMPTELARSLGLTERVLLVAGGHDQACAALAIDADEQTLPVSAGSYECAARVTSFPLNTKEGFRYGLNSYCHVLPGKYVTLAFFVSGMMVQWYLNTFCDAEKKLLGDGIYSHLERQFCAGPTGICVTPHIFGSMNPEWSEHAAAKITGLRADTTKATLYKAVLEGTCCELDLNVRVLEKLAGKLSRLVLAGGGSRSQSWAQLRADITGKPIAVISHEADASCLGAAILAGIGAGCFQTPEQARAQCSRVVQHYAPQQTQLYADQKQKYLGLHRAGLLE